MKQLGAEELRECKSPGCLHSGPRGLSSSKLQPLSATHRGRESIGPAWLLVVLSGSTCDLATLPQLTPVPTQGAGGDTLAWTPPPPNLVPGTAHSSKSSSKSQGYGEWNVLSDKSWQSPELTGEGFVPIWTAWCPISLPLFWNLFLHLGPQLCSHARPERRGPGGPSSPWKFVHLICCLLPLFQSPGSPSECFCPAKRPCTTPPLPPKGEIPVPLPPRWILCGGRWEHG